MERCTIGDAVLRIRSEFVEMPGLQLTLAQARRLWNLDEHICKEMLDVLVDLQFLKKTQAGAYLRRDAAA
jgi:hypothetical protein